jgi:hypothetical protein
LFTILISDTNPDIEAVKDASNDHDEKQLKIIMITPSLFACDEVFKFDSIK